MHTGETPVAKGLPQKPSSLHSDYPVLPSLFLFTEHRTIKVDEVTWWYAIARAEDGKPFFVGVWKPVIGEGYRLPCTNRPLKTILENKRIRDWLEDAFGADSAIVQIPQTPEECHRIIVLDHPYKN